MTRSPVAGSRRRDRYRTMRSTANPLGECTPDAAALPGPSSALEFFTEIFRHSRTKELPMTATDGHGRHDADRSGDSTACRVITPTADEVSEFSAPSAVDTKVSRRAAFRIGAVGTAAALV